MQTIDVPQSASLYRYIENKDLERAYNVACLGVTDSDWKELALASLMALNFKIARAAFIRIRDVRFIELLTKIEIARKQPRKIPQSDEVFLAEILAFQGQFNEAAKVFIKHGRKRRAIEMFLDLRDWARAKEFIESSALLNDNSTENSENDGSDENSYTLMDLLKREANWLLETGDKIGAAEMFWASRDQLTAINILGTHDYFEQLTAKLEELNIETDRPLIIQIASHLKRNNRAKQLKLALIKLNDFGAVIKIIVNEAQTSNNQSEAETLWREAQSLAATNPTFAPLFWLPYAAYLASLDRFEEAQLAYDKAGQPMESIKMLETLIDNAINERRFHDASYYHYLLSNECWKAYDSKLDSEIINWVTKYFHHRRLSELYYAYEFIERYTNEPFTSILPEALFQTSQFVLNAISSSIGQIQGISQVYSLFALAKQSKSLGAFKLGRAAYAKLLKLKLPSSWRDQVEMSALAIRTAPFNDAEELLPVCYRCSTSNPLLGQEKDFDCCINCKHPFIRSFCSFEILPLVKFKLEKDITEEEGKKLISIDPEIAIKDNQGKMSHDQNDTQTLSFDNENSSSSSLQSLNFSDRLLHYEPGVDGHYDDIYVSRDELRAMPSHCVFIRKFPGYLEYYYHTMTDIPVTLCSHCQQFFHAEDREFQLLQFHKCPICRTAQEVDDGENNTQLV